MQQLRLLADDLTGALDTSAELVGAFGTLNVVWLKGSITAEPGSLVVDTGTREVGPEQAAAIMQTFVPLLHDATIAFKKVDSLLRGPWTAELDVCLRSGPWDACVVAPAFAYQGRRTRGGQQYAVGEDGSWRAIGANILDQLRQHGIEAQTGEIGAGLRRGVSVFDAETDDDLDRIVQIVVGLGDIPDVCCGAEPEASPAHCTRNGRHAADKAENSGAWRIRVGSSDNRGPTCDLPVRGGRRQGGARRSRSGQTTAGARCSLRQIAGASWTFQNASGGTI